MDTEIGATGEMSRMADERKKWGEKEAEDSKLPQLGNLIGRQANGSDSKSA